MGIKRSKKAPTKLHPYGYMRDKFVFSLISAVGIFCLGAGVSMWNGFSGLLAASPVEHIGYSAAGMPDQRHNSLRTCVCMPYILGNMSAG